MMSAVNERFEEVGIFFLALNEDGVCFDRCGASRINSGNVFLVR